MVYKTKVSRCEYSGCRASGCRTSGPRASAILVKCSRAIKAMRGRHLKFEFCEMHLICYNFYDIILKTILNPFKILIQLFLKCPNERNCHLSMYIDNF